ELLLFSLGIRSARKKLYLSYQRATAEGSKLTPSTYFQETLRLLDGTVVEIPKQLSAKFTDESLLPTAAERAALPQLFDPREILAERWEHLKSFASQINARDISKAMLVDGCIADPAEIWNTMLTKRNEEAIKIRYSLFKSYLGCPFQFYSSFILGLQDSPKEASEDSQDMNPLLKGI